MTLFSNLNDMHDNDIKNNTSFLGVCNAFVSANTNKQGGIVQMGVPSEVVMGITTDKYIPLLLVIDAKEYDKIKEKNKS